MLGYAHAYEASGGPRYLGAARSAADWYVDHVPEGWIPRYDYDDPDREKLPYDSVRGLHRHRRVDATGALASRIGPSVYRKVASETLKAIVSNFLTTGGVMLHGTWGRMRHIEAGKPRLGRFPQEDIMPYGNYWIAECLFRATVG